MPELSELELVTISRQLARERASIECCEELIKSSEDRILKGKYEDYKRRHIEHFNMLYDYLGGEGR